MSADSTLFSQRKVALNGLLALFVLIVVFGGWSGIARVPGGVIAPAQFEVAGNRNTIQHAEGGLLAEILVSDGEKVSINQPIAILAAPRVLAEYAAIRAKMNETLTRRARLQAERDGAEDLIITPEIARLAEQEPMLDQLFADQKRLLLARREVMNSQSQQLRRRLIQISAQIEGIDAQMFAKREEMVILSDELDLARDMLTKGLIDKSRVDALRRDQSQLGGTLGELAATRAQTKERAVEIELEITRLAAMERETAAEQLSALIPQEIETAQALVAAQSRVDRLTLRASAEGTILGLRHSRPGAVLQPAEVLAWLVPSDRPLILAARISPGQAAELQLGQLVRIQLPQNGLSQDQPLEGHLLALSADSLKDPQTGTGFFRAEIALDPARIDHLRAVGLMPGMTAEAFFVTTERSPLTWLLDPFTRYLSGAMRES